MGIGESSSPEASPGPSKSTCINDLMADALGRSFAQVDRTASEAMQRAIVGGLTISGNTSAASTKLETELDKFETQFKDRYNVDFEDVIRVLKKAHPQLEL